MAKVTKTMPVDFRHHFKRCICIIDCFEVFCERPSDLMARAQTFSDYKHHNTVKFLIAVTPQGSLFLKLEQVAKFIFEIGAGCTVRNVAKNTIEKCMLCHLSFYIVCFKSKQYRRDVGASLPQSRHTGTMTANYTATAVHSYPWK